MFKFVVAVVLVLTLSACAGRPPQIPPLFLATDEGLTCEAIQAEAHINQAKMSDLAAEQNWKLGQNAVAGIVGFMIWPAWLGLDLQDAAGKEARALSQRNAYLATLAQTRCRPLTQTARLPAAAGPDIGPAFASNSELLSGFVSR